MKAVDSFLENYVRFLWLLTGYLGLSAVLITSNFSFNFFGIYIFAIGVVNLLATYGLLRKTAWGWKVAAFAAILNLIYFLTFLVLIGVLINGLILYSVVKFKTRVGGKDGDSILPKYFQKYLS